MPQFSSCNMQQVALFDSYTNDDDVIVWLVSTTVCLGVRNVLYDFHALGHSSEYCVFVVKPRLQTNKHLHLTP